MKKRTLFILFCILFSTCVCAETILLRTGARVKGTIVFQNEEVVIIRDTESGARFQYPRAEVASILTEEEEIQEENTPETEQGDITSSKKVSIALELAGGLGANPGNAFGGAASADLLIGSHHIGDRHIFIGGGVGYHGLFLGKDKYNFLPIQVALRMPFTETKHAPYFGIALGYGVALAKNYQGGIYAGVDLGYRYQVNPKTALALSLFAQFQQAKVTTIETIEGVDFTNTAGRNLVSSGIKLALFF